MGPENITMNEVCNRIGSLLGKKVVYEYVSVEKILELFAQNGISDTVQKEMSDLGMAIGDPDGVYASPRTYESFTPTILETIILSKVLS